MLEPDLVIKKNKFRRFFPFLQKGKTVFVPKLEKFVGTKTHLATKVY